MELSKDFLHALRVLRRNPTATAIIVVTLALCIGANTAIFSVVDATLLRPLAYPEPDRLVQVVTHFSNRGAENDNVGQDGRTWVLVRDHATFLDAAVFSHGSGGVNFSANGTAQYVKQQRVGAGFFRVLGVQPLLGREFLPEEDRRGGPALAVLSYAMWRRAFQQDPSAIGKTLMLRGEPFTIVGVMPENFRSNVPADLWTPLRPSTNGEGGGLNYTVIGRIKAGATWAQADSQIEAVGAPMIRARNYTPSAHVRLHIVSLQEGQTQNVRTPLLVLWAAVGLVLLIGCANVASLLLAQASARSREVATRLALGAGRRAILSQLLMETLAVAVIGAASGLLAGYAGLQGLKAMAEKTYPTLAQAHLDGRVLAVTAALSLLVTVLAGIFPAMEAGAVDLRNALSEAGGRGVAGHRKRWSRRLLVSGEIALAVLLLIGAGLLVRALARLYNLRPGFDGNHVIAASFSLQDARYATNERVDQLYDKGLARIRAIPGVESAGAGLSLPYETGLNTPFWRKDGPQASNDVLTTNLTYVTPGYLETLRIPLLRGRLIRDSDGEKSAPVAVVNEAFVKKYLSHQDPLGSHVSFDESGGDTEIVGVVGDVQQGAGWGHFGPLGAVPNVYTPVTQFGDGGIRMVHTWYPPYWVVRASGAPATIIRGIQEAAAAIDPLLPIAEFHTLDELRAQKLSEQRFQATLLGSLSALALVLALVGIYGLMAQSVVERTRELGIRIALGATLARAIRDAALPGLGLALAGVIAGCFLARLSANVMRHLVYGISTTDSVTYVAVPLGLLLVAAFACLIPALRITRLNPADTLREE